MDYTYAPVVAPPLGSDGHCTGFPDSVGSFNFLHCCIAHDLGGSDGQLLDCLTAEAAPAGWGGAVLIIGCVFVMKLFQPIYNVGQRAGWWK